MYAILHHTEIVTPTVRTLWFQPEQPVRYTAGQFTELYLPHENADGRGQRRWFTLSSSPTEPLLGITTKFTADNPSSFKRELAALTPGTRLHLADPMGDFVLPKDPSIPLVFVAGGLGITPMRSMVKYLLDNKARRSLHLVYVARQAEDMAFTDLFDAYDARLTLLSAAPQDGVAGRLHGKQLIELARPPKNALFYIAGPEQMVERLFKELPDYGIPQERLVTDYFPGYPSL